MEGELARKEEQIHSLERQLATVRLSPLTTNPPSFAHLLHAQNPLIVPNSPI